MQTGSRISPGKIRFPPIFLLENRSVIIHSFPRARTPIRAGKAHKLGRVQHTYTYGCWFVTLDPEYPRLSPLTGSRTSGPAIFAIYLLLVIGLTGESQAEHKRMLFMDVEKTKGKGETFLRWQPLLDFSIRSDRSLKSCFQVVESCAI